MRKLILLLFITALMFGCSREEAGDAVDKAMDSAEDAAETAGEMAEDAAEATKEMASDAADAAKEMVDGDSMDGPKVEPLPDWDSLPPIEEEMAEGEEDSTMMEKAEEVVEEVVEKTEEVVEKAKDKTEEMMKEE